MKISFKRWMTVISIVFLAFFVSVGTGFAEETLTPTELAGGKVISALEARALLDGGDGHFFDTRSPSNFGKSHIPGAKVLPYRSQSENVVNFDAQKDFVDLSQLSQDKKARIVFYSHGDTGWKSYKAAVLAIRKGYTEVLWLRGGLNQWEAQGYPLER